MAGAENRGTTTIANSATNSNVMLLNENFKNILLRKLFQLSALTKPS